MHRSRLALNALPLAVLACATLLPTRRLTAQPTDTTRVSTEPFFTRRDAYIAGAFVVTAVALHPADRSLARRIRADRLQDKDLLRESAAFFRFMGTPGSLYIGGSIYAVGRLGRIERMADLGLHGTEALYLSQGIVGLIKGVAGRARPLVDIEDPRSFQLGRGFQESDHYRSFPSGHAAAAFAAAAAVTSETSKWWPKSVWYIAPAMYGGAALVGISRMYDNKHWASDITIGAALGMFSGLKVVRYHHSHPDNRIDRWLLGAAHVVPGPNEELALAWVIPLPMQ